ncbi:MAG: hypothetical protein FJY97_01760 [candidate division Zixibacteria bacterium]|nr:hypothetical protein [candidate division Zixibacteria bacterium]
MTDLKRQLEHIREKFRTSRLTEPDIDAALALIGTDKPPRQSLLYIQASSTHPYSGVVGISIYEEGKHQDALDEKGEMLYKSIREALDDGWRIVKFPEMALAMDEQNNYGLGYEFILERWR